MDVEGVAWPYQAGQVKDQSQDGTGSCKGTRMRSTRPEAHMVVGSILERGRWTESNSRQCQGVGTPDSSTQSLRQKLDTRVQPQGQGLTYPGSSFGWEDGGGSKRSTVNQSILMSCDAGPLHFL